MQKRKQDIVREAVSVFQQLQARRGQLQSELAEIDRALAQFRGLSSGAAPAAVGRRGRGRGRGRNTMSLREAVTAVVARRPLDRREILQAVQDHGYRFSSKSPGKSLDVFLYGTGKHLFKRTDGKFALAKGKSGRAARRGKTRKMSPAARAKIAAAARARWARIKARQ